MDPDYYGDDGYTYYNSTAGSVSPSKWSGSVDVDNTFQRMVIYARSNTAGKDVDLWVKSPDGDFARAQLIFGSWERYYVYNPVSGTWEIAVVADYPTGSADVDVYIYKKYQGSWYLVATYNFNLVADPYSTTMTIPSVENLKIDIDAINGTKTLHMWVDDGSLHGYYTDSSPFEDSNAGGTYTVYVVADFPYGSQEFELTSYISKIDAAKIAAKTFNGILRDNDLVGVAYFNGTDGGSIRQAEVVQSLTQNKNLANSSIDGLSAYGGTPMGDGIWVAQEELKAHTLVNSIPVIILLSDGNPTLPSPSSKAIQLALQNATNAKNTQVNGENIIIYTIGFGSDANETLLKQIASYPSYYHFAATADELQDIYEQIAKELLENAGTNITITDVLPPDIELSSVPDGATVMYTDDDKTIIQWNISKIRINETWTVSFYVKPQSEGIVETNVYGLSNVTYLPSVNATSFRTIYLPSGQLRVERLETERVELK